MQNHSSRRIPTLLPIIAPIMAIMAVACASPRPRFPIQPSLTKDTDLLPVVSTCHYEPSKTDPKHVACTPELYVSPLAWDGANQMVFRPLSHAFAIAPGREAPNVTAFDEVLDSAWFNNRLGVAPMSVDELSRGACTPKQMLDPDKVPDGGWVIDKGKSDGATPGFRVNIPGKGKYMFKVDADTGGDLIEGELVSHEERPTAASVIGAAVYSAVGFNTSCEQVVYVKPSIFKLTPGLVTRNNAGVEKKFDKAELDKVLKSTTKKGDLLRLTASGWLPGHLLGPFRYTGTRSDDPSDVINHDNRRELRGGRLLAAWIDHFDAREQNSMDTWIATVPGAPDDSSPGYVRHYYLDTSDCLGSEWGWDPVSRRLGQSYLLDWGDIGFDFLTLGIPTRPWELVQRTAGHVKFGYFNVKDFVPEHWKNEYPNAAFSRMTERDGAWMTRILARFTPEMVHELAVMGKFADPSDTEYMSQVLEGRLEKILLRYLSKVSPITDLRVEQGDSLCGLDLAEARQLREESTFHYVATGPGGAPIPVTRRGQGAICLGLPRIARDGGAADDAESRYTTVTIVDGFAPGPLVAHLYDLGPTRGYKLAGIERPEP
jgi:hypothetical protein